MPNTKEYDRQYYLKNKIKLNNYTRQYLKNNPDKKLQYDRMHKWRKRGVKNVDLKMYEYYLSVKDCENCGIELDQDDATKKCLDHCHKTGLFRNVLCKSCNSVRG